jgi:hypothetical protein
MRRIGAHLAEVAERPGVVLPGAAAGAGSAGGSVSSMGSPVDATGPTRSDSDSVPAGKCGLLMLEDVLETLVGEIRDATRRRPEHTRRPSGSSGA